MPRAIRDVNTLRWHRSLRQLRQRQQSLVWWIMAREKHPLGMVPIATAARMMGLSRTRMHNLIKLGRVRVVEGMPGGGRIDRFIPIEDLMRAPMKAMGGRPGLFGVKERKAEHNILNTSVSPGT